MWIAVDPGKINGVAVFKANGNCSYMGQARRDELFALLHKHKEELKGVVCENFRLRPQKATEQSWSELGTVKVIGSIEFFGWLYNIPVILQEPSIKPIAYKRAGITVPTNHKHSHQTDAYVHGIHYLIGQNVIDPIAIMRGTYGKED